MNKGAQKRDLSDPFSVPLLLVKLNVFLHYSIAITYESKGVESGGLNRYGPIDSCVLILAIVSDYIWSGCLL